MVLLKDNFKNSIFSMLVDRYNCKFLTDKFKITHGTLYRYKNKLGVSIPISIVKQCLQMINKNESELNRNIVKIFKPKELRHKCLDIGRNFRKQQLLKWRNQIPKIKDLIENNNLNIEKWFYFYRRLIDFGCRKIENVEIQDDKIIIKHKNYVKREQRNFTVILPRKISINNDFQYFFGLWCGDRVGGGRIGIVNKALELNLITAKYLKNNLYQNPQFVLLKSSRISELPNFNFKIDSVQEVKGMPGDWALCVQSVNGILRSFFYYLHKNLDIFLNMLPNKNIFFAGLFDAEGNVFIEDNCFRWACKNLEKVDIYKNTLKNTICLIDMMVVI